MNKRTEPQINPRLVSTTNGCLYTSMGKNAFMKFSQEAGALLKFGKTTLHDLDRIDAAIDAKHAEGREPAVI